MRSGFLSERGLTGLALIALGAGASLAALTIDPAPDGGWGPRAFPLAASLSILVLGLLQLRGAPEPAAASGRTAPAALRRVLLLLGLAVGYVWLISKIGYLLATGIATPLAMLLFGVRRPWVLLVAAILCPLVYHVIFFRGLGLFPPYGAWFDLAEFIGGN